MSCLLQINKLEQNVANEKISFMNSLSRLDIMMPYPRVVFGVQSRFILWIISELFEFGELTSTIV